MISTVPVSNQGESLSGYLRRVARSQGYTQLNDFNRWLGWNYGRPLVEELPKVATRLGVELTELEALAPTVNADDPLFEWRFHRVHRDPFCPACLKEGRPWQQTWRHCMITACPVHKTRLLDECERCREPLLLRTLSSQIVRSTEFSSFFLPTRAPNARARTGRKVCQKQLLIRSNTWHRFTKCS